MLTLITGVGAKGQVGEAVALAFAKRGDTVLLVSRDEAEVQSRAADLNSAGLKAVGYGCDLANPTAVVELSRRIQSAHGSRIDSLVNLAGGFGLTGPVADSDPTATEKMMRINFTTAYLVTRQFFPALRDARGAIVFFASEKVLEGAKSSGIAAYAAAKSAVVALMRSVADEGREFGIRVNALAPGSIRTATNEAEMGKDIQYIEREDVATAVLFLCSPEARAITGQVIRLRA